jgi:hypothetical protein
LTPDISGDGGQAAFQEGDETVHWVQFQDTADDEEEVAKGEARARDRQPMNSLRQNSGLSNVDQDVRLNLVMPENCDLPEEGSKVRGVHESRREVNFIADPNISFVGTAAKEPKWMNWKDADGGADAGPSRQPTNGISHPQLTRPSSQGNRKMSDKRDEDDWELMTSVIRKSPHPTEGSKGKETMCGFRQPKVDNSFMRDPNIRYGGPAVEVPDGLEYMYTNPLTSPRRSDHDSASPLIGQLDATSRCTD